MACIEHRCIECDWCSFNNSAADPICCPRCGGRLARTFDEEVEHEHGDEEREDDDREAVS